MAGPKLRTWIPLAVVLLTALLWRGLFFMGVQGTPLAAWHTWDQTDMHSFWQQATALAGGDWLARNPYHPYHGWMRVAPPAQWAAWFQSRAFYQPPLYSYFLAVLMRLSGDAAWWARLAQLALGVVNCGLIYGVTRRSFGRGAALAAGLIMAVYGPLLIVESQLLRETAILSLTLAIFYGYATGKGRRGLQWSGAGWKRYALGFGLGVMLGVLAMLHEGAVLLGTAIALAGVMRLRQPFPSSLRDSEVWGLANPALAQIHHERALAETSTPNTMTMTSTSTKNAHKRGKPVATESQMGILCVKWLALLVLGAAAGYAPLLVRNLVVGAPPLPRFAGSAFAFTVANVASTPLGGALFTPTPGLGLIVARANGSVTRLLLEIYHSYNGEWWRWLGHWLMRLGALGIGAENNENLCYEYFRIRVPILSLCIDYRVLLPLCLAGVMRHGLRRWRGSVRRGNVPAALLLNMILVTALISAVVPFGRYRLMFLPFMAPLAGLGAASLVMAWGGRRWRRLGLMLGCVAMIAALQLGLDHLFPLGPLRSAEFGVAAGILRDRGRPDLAKKELESGLRLMPMDTNLQNLLGLTEELLGNDSAAATAFSRVRMLDPNNVLALLHLGWARAAAGEASVRDAKEAEGLARRLLARPEPDRPAALDLLAAAQAAQGDFAQARQTAEAALAGARAENRQTLVRQIEGRLERYRKNQAYQRGR